MHDEARQRQSKARPGGVTRNAVWQGKIGRPGQIVPGGLVFLEGLKNETHRHEIKNREKG
jgi:hypothetical protein